MRIDPCFLETPNVYWIGRCVVDGAFVPGEETFEDLLWHVPCEIEEETRWRMRMLKSEPGLDVVVVVEAECVPDVKGLEQTKPVVLC